MTKIFIFMAVLLSMVLFLSGCRPPELEGAYVEFNGQRYDNALASAKDAVKKYPDNAEAWMLLGKIYGKKDSIEAMVDAFDKSLAIGPTYKTDIQNEKNSYFATKYNSAVSNFNNYTKIGNRDSEEAHKTLKKAIQNFLQSNLIKPTYNALRLAGVSYKLMGDTVETLKTFEQLTSQYPDSSEAWSQLGTVYFNKKDYEKSIDYFKKAQEIDPKNVDAITFLAQIYDNLKRRPEAIDAYKKAMALAPDEKAFPFNLGLIYINGANEEGITQEKKTNYLEGAASNFGKVLKLDPENNDAYRLKGLAELLLEKYDIAKTTLESGIEKFPKDSDMWYNLGVCYARLNNKDKAKEAFDKAEALKK